MEIGSTKESIVIGGHQRGGIKTTQGISAYQQIVHKQLDPFHIRCIKDSANEIY
jgi:hypothetical protein